MVPLTVISLGADGAFASLRGEAVRVPIAPTELVDTVGAGDSFHGGLLHHLAKIGRLGGRLEELTLPELTESLEFASRVSAILATTPLLTLGSVAVVHALWPVAIAPAGVGALGYLGAGLVVLGSALASLMGRKRAV